MDWPVTTPIQAGTRIRLESIPSSDWDALAGAYRQLQNGPVPRSLLDQQRVHAFFGGGGALVDVHNDAGIFLWHRWFLFFHERLLASLGQGPIVLPYWDGSLDPNLPIPQRMRSDASFRPVGGQSGCGSPGPASQGSAVLRNLAEAPDIVGAYNAISAWHGDVHNCVAQFNDRSCQMVQPEFSAGDPIFYPYHAQVDRLFEWWRNLPNRTPIDPSFLELRYAFWDFPPSAPPRCVCVRAGDALKLQYTYDGPAPNFRQGDFLPGGRDGGAPTDTLEIRAALLHHDVKQYLVVLRNGQGQFPVGRLNVFGHPGRKNMWYGRAVYRVPDGLRSRTSITAELRPIRTDRKPIALRRGEYGFVTARVL